jgi:hypothetical protein
MVLDGTTQRAEFWRLLNGVYQVQQLDESGRYPVSSIPGLTVLTEQYGVDRVAVAGDLVTKGYLGVWSDLVLLVWGLPEED